jgi:hypothetical protein
MPRKPKRPCSFPGCPELTDGRYCDMHQRQMDAYYNKYERDPQTRKCYLFPSCYPGISKKVTSQTRFTSAFADFVTLLPLFWGRYRHKYLYFFIFYFSKNNFISRAYI